MDFDHALDDRALHASLAAAALDPDLETRFYARLFGRHPQLWPLLGRAIPAQQGALLHALRAFLAHLDQPATLRRELHSIGVFHLRFGVTEAMYEWFGVCLLETMAESLGTGWTPRISAAWQEAYGALSATMVEGAELTSVPTLRAAG